MKKITISALATALLVGAALILSGLQSTTTGRHFDASGATSTKPVKTGTLSAIPATCGAGEFYWATDGATARKLYTCESTNTWVQTAYTQGTSAPGTCSVGDVFFDTDATAGQNVYGCTASNTWTLQGDGGGFTARDNLQGTTTLDFWPGDPRVVWVRDEFPGGTLAGALGESSWVISNFAGTGAISRIAGTWPNLGIMSIASGATSGNASGISYGGSLSWGALMANTTSFWEAYWVFALDRTANMKARIGIGTTGASVIPTASVYFLGIRYDTTLSDANYQFAWTSGTTSELVFDTGVAANTAYHTVRLYTDATNNNRLYLQFDGGTARSICNSGCDITSTGTSWATSNYQPVAQVGTDTSTAAKIYTDMFSFRARVGSNTAKRN